MKSLKLRDTTHFNPTTKKGDMRDRNLGLVAWGEDLNKTKAHEKEGGVKT